MALSTKCGSVECCHGDSARVCSCPRAARYDRPRRYVLHNLLLDSDLGEFLPDQRGHGLPWARGALQASAVIWARCSAVKVRRVPARGVSRTLSVCCQRCRQRLTVWTQQPTCRAISACRQVGC